MGPNSVNIGSQHLHTTALLPLVWNQPPLNVAPLKQRICNATSFHTLLVLHMVSFTEYIPPLISHFLKISRARFKEVFYSFCSWALPLCLHVWVNNWENSIDWIELVNTLGDTFSSQKSCTKLFSILSQTIGLLYIFSIYVTPQNHFCDFFPNVFVSRPHCMREQPNEPKYQLHLGTDSFSCLHQLLKFDFRLDDWGKNGTF